jgi:hypothetical protein
MGERGDGTRLVLEPRHSFVIAGGAIGEHLDRDVAPEPRVAGR